MYIDDEFKDWLVGQLPLFLISGLYNAYAFEQKHKGRGLPKNAEQTSMAEFEHVLGLDRMADFAFTDEVVAFRKYLDAKFPNKIDE